jgi:hypothetical protein
MLLLSSPTVPFLSSSSFPLPLSLLFSQFDAIVTDPPYSKREKAVTFDSPSSPSSNVSTSFLSSSSVVNSIAASSVQERGELKKGRERIAEENGEKGERRQGKYGDVKKGKKMNRGIEINSTRESSSSSVPSDSLSSSSSPLGDAFATTTCLLALASYRLKKG